MSKICYHVPFGTAQHQLEQFLTQQKSLLAPEEYNNLLLKVYAARSNAEGVLTLLPSIKDINHTDKYHENPLYLALHFNRIGYSWLETSLLLIENGAELPCKPRSIYGLNQYHQAVILAKSVAKAQTTKFPWKWLDGNFKKIFLAKLKYDLSEQGLPGSYNEFFDFLETDCQNILSLDLRNDILKLLLTSAQKLAEDENNLDILLNGQKDLYPYPLILLEIIESGKITEEAKKILNSYKNAFENKPALTNIIDRLKNQTITPTEKKLLKYFIIQNSGEVFGSLNAEKLFNFIKNTANLKLIKLLSKDYILPYKAHSLVLKLNILLEKHLQQTKQEENKDFNMRLSGDSSDVDDGMDTE